MQNDCGKIFPVMKMGTHNRKPLRLQNYNYGTIGAYFVTICTQNRANIFEMELPSISNSERFYHKDSRSGESINSVSANAILHKWIAAIPEKYADVHIDRYVIMPDHIHLLITINRSHTGIALPEIIHFWKAATTNAYIQGVKNGYLPRFNGKLWQKSYYDHVIRNQQDYNDIWEYIEGNPAKWLDTHPL